MGTTMLSSHDHQSVSCHGIERDTINIVILLSGFFTHGNKQILCKVAAVGNLFKQISFITT